MGTKDSSKKEIKKPLSFSEMAKKPGVPQPIVKRIPFPEKTIAQTNRPHCYFKVGPKSQKMLTIITFRFKWIMKPHLE